MVEKVVTSSRTVVDFASYRRDRNVVGKAPAMSARLCRYCNAALAEGEREDECSSAFNVESASLRWQAAQILRGLI